MICLKMNFIEGKLKADTFNSLMKYIMHLTQNGDDLIFLNAVGKTDCGKIQDAEVRNWEEAFSDAMNHINDISDMDISNFNKKKWLNAMDTDILSRIKSASTGKDVICEGEGKKSILPPRKWQFRLQNRVGICILLRLNDETLTAEDVDQIQNGAMALIVDQYEQGNIIDGYISDTSDGDYTYKRYAGIHFSTRIESKFQMGFEWAFIIKRHFIDALGGMDHIKNTMPVYNTTMFSDGSLLVQVTKDIRFMEEKDLVAVGECLSPILFPIRAVSPNEYYQHFDTRFYEYDQSFSVFNKFLLGVPVKIVSTKDCDSMLFHIRVNDIDSNQILNVASTIENSIWDKYVKIMPATIERHDELVIVRIPLHPATPYSPLLEWLAEYIDKLLNAGIGVQSITYFVKAACG